MNRFLVLLCLCSGILPACEFFPEATFQLSPNSRLPKWFTVPAGMARSDLTVTMSYYVKPLGPDVIVELYDSHHHRMAKLSGNTRGSGPIHLRASGLPGSPPGYPTYEVITINGVVEVVEHRRMERIFYVTDDPSVWRELGVPAN